MDWWPDKYDHSLERYHLPKPLGSASGLHGSWVYMWVRHNCIGGCTPKTLRIGDVVILREDESNRGYCWIGMAVHLFNAREGVVLQWNLLQGKPALRDPSSSSTSKAIGHQSVTTSAVIKSESWHISFSSEKRCSSCCWIAHPGCHARWADPKEVRTEFIHIQISSAENFLIEILSVFSRVIVWYCDLNDISFLQKPHGVGCLNWTKHFFYV